MRWHLRECREQIQPLVRDWGTDYDWRTVEAKPNARPLLITHGWSGSILELLKVMGPLTDPTTQEERRLRTHGLVVRLTDRAALEAYGLHPEHQRVLQNFIDPIRADILALNYEF